MGPGSHGCFFQQLVIIPAVLEILPKCVWVDRPSRPAGTWRPRCCAWLRQCRGASNPGIPQIPDDSTKLQNELAVLQYFNVTDFQKGGGGAGASVGNAADVVEVGSGALCNRIWKMKLLY